MSEILCRKAVLLSVSLKSATVELSCWECSMQCLVFLKLYIPLYPLQNTQAMKTRQGCCLLFSPTRLVGHSIFWKTVFASPQLSYFSFDKEESCRNFRYVSAWPLFPSKGSAFWSPDYLLCFSMAVILSLNTWPVDFNCKACLWNGRFFLN